MLFGAQAGIDSYFDPTQNDTIPFLARYEKLIKDRENRQYLDVLYHQLGLFYDKQKKPTQATKNYNKSLRANSTDKYLLASNYRNLGNIDFDRALYASAGKYYDSTLALMNPKTREYRLYSKKRENLDDVIRFEKIAFENDSILSVLKMSKPEQIRILYQTCR
ncbi:MAG: tetratricopeptide repeat protein [Ottowia sp.]